MKKIETVKEHCKHKDCIYRRHISGGDVPICFYAAIMFETRKCKISKCDKYRKGTKKPHSTEEYIEWELDYDDDYL